MSGSVSSTTNPPHPDKKKEGNREVLSCTCWIVNLDSLKRVLK